MKKQEKNRTAKSGIFNPRIFLAFTLCSVGGLLAMLSFAATPPSGTINLTSSPLKWDGRDATGTGAAGGESSCVENNPHLPGDNCDTFTLTVGGTQADWAVASKRIDVTIAPSDGSSNPSQDSYELIIHKTDNTGPIVDSSANGAGQPEIAHIYPATDGVGVFTVHVLYVTTVPGDYYKGTATVVPVTPQVVSGNGTTLLNWMTCNPTPTNDVPLPNIQNWEQEPSLAVNPTDPNNPNNLVAAWIQGFNNGIVVGHSTDGGQTWNQVVPPTNSCTGGAPFIHAADPWLSFGLPFPPTAQQGIAYLSSNVGDINCDVGVTTTNCVGGTAVIVNRSTDGGQTWSAPAELWSVPGGPAEPSPCDANLDDGSCVGVGGSNVLADPSRPGFAYATWTGQKLLPTGETSGNVYASHTTDGGLTWSTPSKIPSDPDQPDNLQGVGRLVILPPTDTISNGTLVDVFIEIPPFHPTDPNAILGPTKLMAARSTDGGITWPNPITIAGPDANPNLEVPSAALAPDGTIYVAWQRADSSGSSFTLMYSKSTDGANWSAPASVGGSIPGPIETGVRLTVAAAPSLAVAPDGTVGVAFYDHRNNPEPTGTACNGYHPGVPCFVTDYWFRRSHDGGQTWEEEHLSGSFDQATAPDGTFALAHFIGDYQGIAPVPGGFATAFTLARRIPPFGQRLANPLPDPTDIFYLKLNSDEKLLGVVSRKVHGDAGSFDIDLPLTGTPGIECRSGGASGDYTLVFTFVNPLTSVGEAHVTSHNPTSATGTVVNSMIDSTDAHNYIVNLTGVSNAQLITVSLTNVTDSAGNFNAVVPEASMGVLIGDVNASRRVDAADVSLVRQQTLQTITSDNFREDINASGRIDAADVSIARQQTLTSLP